MKKVIVVLIIIVMLFSGCVTMNQDSYEAKDAKNATFIEGVFTSITVTFIGGVFYTVLEYIH